MPSLKRILKITGLILFIGFVIQFLFDPFAYYKNQRKLDNLQSELVVAKSKWESKNIKDYSFEIEQGIPLWGICHAKITVKQDRIVEVAANTYPLFAEPLKDKPLVILEKEKWDGDYCKYSRLTIPEIFGMVQLFINEKKNITFATFDHDLGYVIDVHGNSNVNSGLLIAGLGDTNFSYTFTNFQLFDSSKP